MSRSTRLTPPDSHLTLPFRTAPRYKTQMQPPRIVKPDDVLFLAVKHRVIAINKHDGQILWSAELPGGLGTGFVTVLSDGKCVFAHTHGTLHCLDISSGRILWTNGLAGCGYGIASLCFADGSAAPNPGAVQTIIAQQQQHTGAAPST